MSLRRTASALTLGLMMACTSLTSPAVAAPPTAGLYDRANLDPAVKPQVDFYQYAVGGYLKRHPIPPDRSSYGVDAELTDRVQNLLHQILERLSQKPQKPGTNEQKLGDFYASGMNTKAIDAAGLGPVKKELAAIEAIADIPAMQAMVAQLHRQNVDVLFSFGPDQDFKNPDMVIGEFSQGGLSLPDRDYYVIDDADKRRVRDAFVTHMQRMFALMGEDAATSEAHAKAVMAIEMRLAKSSMPADELRDPKKLDNPSAVADFQKKVPSLDWARYFQQVGIQPLARVNVATPPFFNDMEATLHDIPLDDWKTYLRWHLMNTMAPYLSSRFDREDFDFKGRVLSGVKQQMPRWRRVVAWTDAYLGEALGRKFVELRFSPAAKARALELVKDIEAVVRDRITHGWMSEGSRKEALAKVDRLVKKIGYPDRWKDYSTLRIDRGLFADNVLRARTFAAHDELRRIGKKVDRNKWDMTPSTVNAYYDPQKNEIVFPAAILQPPYFDVHADDATNYGETGATIGHELTHGFDDEGSQFDDHGNLRNWWSEADKKHFDELGDAVAKQFSEFVYDGQKVDGKRVEGESLADLGGLELAFAAFKKAQARHPEPAKGADGFTPDQRFFLNYAFSWATNIRKERAHMQISSNPHPLAEFRVNGPLADMPAFWAAFHVKPGDPMRRPDAVRARLWDN